MIQLLNMNPEIPIPAPRTKKSVLPEKPIPAPRTKKSVLPEKPISAPRRKPIPAPRRKPIPEKPIPAPRRNIQKAIDTMLGLVEWLKESGKKITRTISSTLNTLRKEINYPI